MSLLDRSDPQSRSSNPALQTLLEKYPAYDLRAALVRANVEASFFLSLPPLTGGRAHAQVVSELIEELTRHGWLQPRSEATRKLLQAFVEMRPGLYREVSAIATKYFAIGLPAVDPDLDEPTLVRLKPGMLEGQERLRLIDELQSLTVKRSNIAENKRESEDLRLKINAIARELHATGGVRRGQLIAGTILEDVLASGSFGTVWKARSATSAEPRATKVFHLDKLSQGLMLARFRQSIEMIRLLTSDPHSPDSIVKIHQVSEDGLAFSMDYAACGSLESLRKYEWTVPTILDRFRKICEACHFAHEKGVIHRDIKPSNILLDEHLQPILIDFDISDATTSRIAYLGASTQGWLGTPVFGSPEQLHDARDTSRQSDVFSLGRLLHFMLLRGTSPGMLTEHEPDLEDLSTFPATIVQIVRKATRYDPRRRYSSVKEVIDDIDRYQTGWAAVRVALQRMARWVRRHRAPAAIFGLITATILGLWRYVDLLERQRLQAQIEGLQTHCVTEPCRCPAFDDPETDWNLAQTIQTWLAAVSDTPVADEGSAEASPAPPDRRPSRLTESPPPESPRAPPLTNPERDHRGSSRRVVTSEVSHSSPSEPGLRDSARQLRSATQALAEAWEDIEKDCARQVWPVLHFTLTLQAQEGRLHAVRSDSKEWHPAVLCATDALARVKFDIMDLGEKLQRHHEFIHPDAPTKDIQTYRSIRRLTVDGKKHRDAAKRAPST